MEYLSFAYLVTEDSRYAAKAKEIMWVVLRWDTWFMDDREDYLSVGAASAGLAVTYDWMFKYLTPEERAFAADTIGRHGAKPLYDATMMGKSWNQPVTARSHSNWIGITQGGLGLAGLSLLGEHPDAPKWVELAASRIEQYFAAGGANGGWGEGLHYWWYGLRIAIPFADSLRRVTGRDLYQSPFLRETLYFPIYLFTPGLERIANFGDSWLDSGVYAWTAVLTLRLSSEYANGYGMEFFNTIRNQYEPEAPWMWDRVVGVFAIIWYDGSIRPKPLPNLPFSRLFEGLGWVVARSGWGSDDIYLAFKSGPNWYHSHSDQNNFIFEAFGQPLIVDLGAGAYTSKYWDRSYAQDYHQASIGHNVILVNGMGQFDSRSWWGSPPAGKVTTFQSFAGPETYEYIVGDASDAYVPTTSFVRQIVFVQHRFVVVLDSIKSQGQFSFQWLAHTTGEISTTGANEFTIVKENVSLTIKFLLPQTLDSHVYSEQQSQITWSETEPAPRLEVHHANPDPAATTAFLAVLYPARLREAPPKISFAQNSTVWTLKVEDNSTHYLFFNATTPIPLLEAEKSQKASLMETAFNLITKVDAEVTKAAQEGKTQGLDLAKGKLEAAKAAYASEKYETALSLALESWRLLGNATIPVVSQSATSNTSLSSVTSSTEISVMTNWNNIALATSVVLVLGLVLLLCVKKLRRKPNSARS
jgi:hypothetical protein